MSWAPPTKNFDGSTLDDTNTYKFSYGLSEGSYPNDIRVDRPGISSYVVDSLAPGTYYFVATVINGNDVESVYSNVASVTVTAN